MLLCILSYSFMVSIKNLDLDSEYDQCPDPVTFSVLSQIKPHTPHLGPIPLIPLSFSLETVGGGAVKHEAVQHCGGVVWSV